MVRRVIIAITGALLSFAVLIGAQGLCAYSNPAIEETLRRLTFWEEVRALYWHRIDYGCEPKWLVGDIFYIYETFYPLAALAAGLFVGSFTSRRTWVVSAISLMPLLAHFMRTSTWENEKLVMMGLYLLIAAMAAKFIHRLRTNRRERVQPQV